MIMKSEEFRKSTKIKKLTGTDDPILFDIAMLLDAFWGGQVSRNRIIKIMTLMYFLCLEHQRVNGRDGKLDKVAKTIDKLMAQIQHEMDSPDTGYQRQFQKKLQGERYSGGVKVAEASTKGTKLGEAYKFESVLPQKNLVSKYQLNTTVRSYGISLLSEYLEGELQRNGMTSDAAKDQVHAQLENATTSQVCKLVHEMGQDPSWKNITFNFYNSAQRQVYEVTYNNGIFSCAGMTPYSTGGSKMYILATSGHMYIPEGVKGVGGGNFNHSSMLSGAPVMCAGECIIEAGYLKMINNASGHYKPGALALIEAVQHLIGMGVNAYSFKVVEQKSGITYNRANTFLTAFQVDTGRTKSIQNTKT
jgi:hypothetical protein